MTIVQADLTEQQRERLTSHLAIRGIPLHNTRVTLSGQRFWTCSVLRDRRLTTLLFARPTNRGPFSYNITESWKAVLATG